MLTLKEILASLVLLTVLVLGMGAVLNVSCMDQQVAYNAITNN